VKAKQAKALNERLARELKELEEKTSGTRRGLKDDDAEIARLKAEMEKSKGPPEGEK